MASIKVTQNGPLQVEGVLLNLGAQCEKIFSKLFFFAFQGSDLRCERCCHQ